MMYLDHFGLSQPPFRLSPDPEFLYLSKQHAKAKAYMESTIWLADGFVVITGEIGSGKTTVLNLLGGLTKPTRGEVWVGDDELGLEPRDPGERRLGGIRRLYLVPGVSQLFSKRLGCLAG